MEKVPYTLPMAVRRIINRDLWNEEYEVVVPIRALPIGLSYVPKVATPKTPDGTRTFINYITLNQGYSTAYCLPEHKSRNSNIEGLIHSKKYDGDLSKKAMNKLRKALNWLMTISELKTVYSMKEKKEFRFKISFITLTLSAKQEHSDEYIKKHMLAPFLKWMYRQHNAKNYIWKAETQKNGNIHFHITTNKFIHHRAIRNKWNSIQFNHGYLQRYKIENKSDSPNSTDVHSVKNDKLIIGYFLKYMAKNEKDKRKITGRLWDCSTELKNSSIILSQLDDGYNELGYTLNKDGNCKIKSKEWCCIYVHNKKLYNQFPEIIQAQIREKIRVAKKSDNGQRRFEIDSFK